MPTLALPAANARPVRALTVAHLSFAAAFVVVTALYVGRMAAAGVGPAEMLTGAYDPKDVVPFGDYAWNPFFWLYGAVAILYLVGFVVSPALALVSLPLLARDWHGLSRRARGLLLAGIVSAVALPLLRFAPFLDGMRQWWLD